RERGGARGQVIGAAAIGLAGGIVAGLLGVGGGVLFVPGLVIFMDLTQHQAEATSLLAIIPVAIVGAVMQDRYGNVRRGDALLLGLLSVAGAASGVALANALSGKVLQVGFALFMLFVAGQLVRKNVRKNVSSPKGA
ncbi:MAG: TSUP family transporter, partial [Solirubrobacterales bacterium]